LKLYSFIYIIKIDAESFNIRPDRSHKKIQAAGKDTHRPRPACGPADTAASYQPEQWLDKHEAGHSADACRKHRPGRDHKKRHKAYIPN